jgi:hypothetical protein
LLPPPSPPAAIKGNSSPAPPKVGSTYSEADWNETSALPAEAYWVSKVQAERAAWQLAEEHGLDLVTILPGERWAAAGGEAAGGLAPGTGGCTWRRTACCPGCTAG